MSVNQFYNLTTGRSSLEGRVSRFGERGTYELVSLEKTPISVEFSNWVPIQFSHRPRLIQTVERIQLTDSHIDEGMCFGSVFR